MFKIMSVFYLVFICALVTSQDSQKKVKIHVLFSTVKSDLELILADPDKPSTVNIEYTKGAVLHVSLHNQHYTPDQEPFEKYIEIDGKVKIKTKDDVKEERNNVVFVDGKFVQYYNGYSQLLFTSKMEKTTYLVIKPSSHDQPKPADKTISYFSTSQLKKELISKINEMKQKGIQNNHEVKDCICLGSFSVPLTFEFENKFLHLKKPLKGISLSKNEVQDDIMLDVWYRSGSRRIRSSSRSFEGIDAVRVYDEWYQLQDEETSPETPLPEEGEKIRKKVFELDMNTAYERLHNEKFRHTNNVFLLYGSNIVLEAWGRDDGQRKYIEAMGTTMADATGRGQTNVNAFYDLHQCKYSDKLEHGPNFVPHSSVEGSYYVMYTAVEKLGSHIKAVWAVMQGACDSKREVYHFSIFYGESIKVNYNCNTKNIEMEENHKFKMLAESKSAGTILHECGHLRYMSYTSHLEIQCRNVNAKPIAIRQRPRQLWLNDGHPELMRATLLTAEMSLLKDILITNRNSESNKPTKGVSTLDGHVLFKMQLPNSEENPSYVVVHADFQVKSNSRDLSYNQLNFDGAQFTDVEGTSSIKLTDIFTSPQYDSQDYPKGMHVIGSAFWTIKRLQETLKLASELATIRCEGTKSKSYSVKLVHLNLFALVGLYECSKQVFLFKGKFKAFILSKTDQNVEILTERRITNFIYVVRDNFFIAGTESFDDVYAIRLPVMGTDLKEAVKNYGSPQKIKHQNTLFMLQSQEVPSRKMTLPVACGC